MKHSKEVQVVTGYERVEKTPFAIVTVGEKVTIAIGNSRVTEYEFNNADEAKEYINSKPYDLIMNMIFWVDNKKNELNNLKEEETSNE